MNKNRSIIKIAVPLLIIVLTFFLSSFFVQENGMEKNGMTKTMENEKLDALFNDTFDALPIKGLSAAITNENETVYSKQFGNGIDEHTSFILGSTSKAVTATATLMLINEYGLTITDYAGKYLPWISPKITLLDLLNHTSGISTYEKMDNIKYLGKQGNFEYSNTNYNILGEIIEAVSDATFSQYVQTHIFNKLNMDDSFDLSENTSTKVASGYQSYFGVPVLYNSQIPNKSTWIQAPSGYLCSSTADMTKYLQFMLRYPQNNVSLLENIKSNGVEVQNNAAINGIYADKGLYGFGWIHKNVDGTDILYHTGKTSSFTSISVLIPEKNLTITILCNMGDFLVGTNLIEKLYESVISVILETNEALHVDKNAYRIQHGIINLILILVFLLCIIPLILLVKTNKLPQANLVNVCKLLLIHIIAPAFLICFFPIIKTPYDVAYDFAPDILFVTIICSLTLFLTGILKAVLMFIKQKNINQIN